MQAICSFANKKKINQRKERPSMIKMKNYLHPPLLCFWINLWDWPLYFIRDEGGAMKPRRKICDFTTSRQIIAKVKSNGLTSIRIGDTDTIKHGRIELDTHSDKIVFGQSFI